MSGLFFLRTLVNKGWSAFERLIRPKVVWSMALYDDRTGQLLFAYKRELGCFPFLDSRRLKGRLGCECVCVCVCAHVVSCILVWLYSVNY